ncbi:MAG: peptidylprolyl isomerase [Eubacteriales bacterium]
MKEKKTEKDLSILDSQDVEIKNVDVQGNAPTDEKKKIKPWILILSVFLIIVVAAAAVYSWYDYTTLATYTGGRVTRAEFNESVETAIQANPEYEEMIMQYKDQMLISLAQEEVFYKQLDNLGVGQMTKEEMQTIRDEAVQTVDSYVNSNLSSIISGLPDGYTEKDLTKALSDFRDEILVSSGFKDIDDFVDYVTKQKMVNKAYEELLTEEENAPTNEEVEAKYDALLEMQKTAYDENPAAYLNERGTLEMSLYIPSGIRYVRHILIKLDDEALSEIQNLRYEGKDDEADLKYDEALAALKPKAEEILAKIDAGEITFKDAITEFGEDPGMSSYPDGYEVCEGYDMYVEEFTTASMELTEVGQYSGLVATSYGYHIIEYYKDMESVTTPFSDVATTIYQTLLDSNKEDRWFAMIDQWVIDLNLKYRDETLNMDAVN